MTKPDAILLSILVAVIFFTLGDYVGLHTAGINVDKVKVIHAAYYCGKKGK
jgi:hypothetical protein